MAPRCVYPDRYASTGSVVPCDLTEASRFPNRLGCDSIRVYSLGIPVTGYSCRVGSALPPMDEKSHRAPSLSNRISFGHPPCPDSPPLAFLAILGHANLDLSGAGPSPPAEAAGADPRGHRARGFSRRGDQKAGADAVLAGQTERQEPAAHAVRPPRRRDGLPVSRN